MYGALSWGTQLPPQRRLSVSEVLALLPGLEPEGLLGGFEYYDCQAVYPERLALELALQAEESGADIRNHSRVTGFLTTGARVEGVEFESAGGGGALRGRVVVNAAGAWADELLGLLPDSRARRLLTLVNGTHIVLPDFPGSPGHALYHEARSDGRPFFIVPWRGLYLVGTTETLFDGDPDRMLPAGREVRYLLEEANALFPGAGLGPDSVLYAYCGSRPLLRSRRRNLNRASRGHEVVVHERRDGVAGLLTMAGGKLTTALSFADEVARHVAHKLGLPGARAQARRARPVQQGAMPRLGRTYGPRAEEVRRYIASAPELARPLADGCPVTCGEIRFSVEREKARTLGDILLRRTGLAFDPSYQPYWAERAARVAAPALGWDAARASVAIAEFEKELGLTLVRPRRNARPRQTPIRIR